MFFSFALLLVLFFNESSPPWVIGPFLTLQCRTWQIIIVFQPGSMHQLFPLSSTQKFMNYNLWRPSSCLCIQWTPVLIPPSTAKLAFLILWQVKPNNCHGQLFRGYLKVKPGCSVEKDQQGFLAKGFPKIIFHSRLLGLSGGNDLYPHTARKSQHFVRKGTRPAIFQVHGHYPQNEQAHGCFLTFQKNLSM